MCIDDSAGFSWGKKGKREERRWKDSRCWDASQLVFGLLTRGRGRERNKQHAGQGSNDKTHFLLVFFFGYRFVSTHRWRHPKLPPSKRLQKRKDHESESTVSFPFKFHSASLIQQDCVNRLEPVRVPSELAAWLTMWKLKKISWKLKSTFKTQTRDRLSRFGS